MIEVQYFRVTSPRHSRTRTNGFMRSTRRSTGILVIPTVKSWAECQILMPRCALFLLASATVQAVKTPQLNRSCHIIATENRKAAPQRTAHIYQPTVRIARRNTSTNIIAEQHSKVTISLKFSNIIVTMNTHSTQTLGFEYFAAVAFIGEIKSKISPGVLARHIYIYRREWSLSQAYQLVRRRLTVFVLLHVKLSANV